MRTEKEIDPSKRYLLCDSVISDKTLAIVKSDVRRFMKDREKDTTYHQFINWIPQQNEMVVLSLYAYADMPIPKQYNIIFQIGQPENYISADFTITQAIINGWTSVRELGYGHKHIIIIQFPKGIPSIFDILPVFSVERNIRKEYQLGLCTKFDFESIRNNTSFT
jgi:hypothetical protein